MCTVKRPSLVAKNGKNLCLGRKKVWVKISNFCQTCSRYLVFTSKHHEGFTNWPSSYSFGWNSVDIGPKRNVLGELKEALDERQPGVKFGVYYSLFEWFHPLYLHDKANNFTTRWLGDPPFSLSLVCKYCFGFLCYFYLQRICFE